MTEWQIDILKGFNMKLYDVYHTFHILDTLPVLLDTQFFISDCFQTQLTKKIPGFFFTAKLLEWSNRFFCVVNLCHMIHFVFQNNVTQNFHSVLLFSNSTFILSYHSTQVHRFSSRSPMQWNTICVSIVFLFPKNRLVLFSWLIRFVVVKIY